MSTTELLYAALPAGLLVAGLLAVPFRVRAVAIPTRLTPQGRLQAWADIPLRWGLGIVVVGFAGGALAPGLLTGWNSSLARRVFLEGAAVAVGVWFLIGLLSHLYAFAADEDRPRPTPADVIVVAGVFVLSVTGIVLTLAYRWTSSWGSVVAGSWVRSMLGGSAKPELIGDLPILARVHALTVFAVIAVFPYSRWFGWVLRPLRGLRRFWQELAAPPSNRPAGSWSAWGPATGRAVLVVAYFMVLTVIVPSAVVERLGSDIPAALRDLISVAVWGFFLFGGIVGLRWLQRKARV